MCDACAPEPEGHTNLMQGGRGGVGGSVGKLKGARPSCTWDSQLWMHHYNL